ncbi:hypothetical protein FOA52_005464 [Chlamydomonas sp. UWO 241]|nr:hypothetical protein FOA52_005464 [Chlamydomonas sp. UWO 241]
MGVEVFERRDQPSGMARRALRVFSSMSTQQASLPGILGSLQQGITSAMSRGGTGGVEQHIGDGAGVRELHQGTTWASQPSSGRGAAQPLFSLARALTTGRPPVAPSTAVGPPTLQPTEGEADSTSSSGSGGVVHIACLSRKGHAPGYKTENQDSMFVYDAFPARARLLFGVFDGHGSSGHDVSGFVREALPGALYDRLADGMAPEDALPAVIASVNARLETAPRDRGPTCPGCGGQCGVCLPRCGFDAYNSGTTAVVSILEGSTLTTAWVGDSRAVLGVQRRGPIRAAAGAAAGPAAAGPAAAAAGSTPAPPLPHTSEGSEFSSFHAERMPGSSGEGPGSSGSVNSSAAAGSRRSSSSAAGAAAAAAEWQAIELTRDHKPDRPDERRRVLLYGGRVAQTPGGAGRAGVGPYRVWLKDYDYPGLAMSRAMGDLGARPAGIICTPDVSRVELPVVSRSVTDGSTTGGDCFLILASDGVWEFMSNQEVVDLVGRHLVWGASGSGSGGAGKGGRAGGGSHSGGTQGALWDERAPLLPPHGAGSPSARAPRFPGARHAQEVAAAARSPGALGVAAACRAVADASLKRWVREYEGQYIDDITVVVAQFERGSVVAAPVAAGTQGSRAKL